ncbi:MAG: hypothetical protein HY331_14915 [Chloroflexi bacterium]|nr:hypothetical protein [Chloroflexota bacterium]
MAVRLDAVVKVGGSLVEGPALDVVCRELAALAGASRLLVVAGGGPLADAVRDLDRRYCLRDDTAHWMAILAMDQLGYFLAERIPDAVPARTEAEIEAALAAGRLPIWLPYRLLHALDPLPRSWEVTSDSIAAWAAGYLGSPLVVLLKSVDGLGAASREAEPPGGIEPPRRQGRQEGCREGFAGPGNPAGTCPGGSDGLIAEVRRSELGQYGEIDAYLGRALTPGLTCWVINGTTPGRLEELLRAGRTRGTRIAG